MIPARCRCCDVPLVLASMRFVGAADYSEVGEGVLALVNCECGATYAPPLGLLYEKEEVYGSCESAERAAHHSVHAG